MKWFWRQEDPKSKKLRDTYLAAFNATVALLTPETILIKSANKLHFEYERGVINGAALGYIYGLADAVMQRFELELKSEMGMMVVERLFELFSPGNGLRYFQFVVENGLRDDVFSGIIDGGETYVRWTRSAQAVMPFGLGKYLGMRANPPH